MDLLALGLPLWWLQIVAFVFGLIIGSFLNVYIYRFNTGKSLAGRSHCLSCGMPLRWFDLFPLLSFLLLRSRCRVCGCRIPARYFAVELLTGLLFVATLTLSTDLWEVLVWFAILSVLVVILVYDINHFIIPDALTQSVLLLALLEKGYEITQGSSFETIGFDLLAALLGAGFFLFLFAVSRGKWLGFGDVKLAFPLGVLVGYGSVFSFIVLSFWIGAAMSLGIILYQQLKRGQALLQLRSTHLTMKSAVPFAPFLIAGCLTVLFTHFDVLTIFYF
ncbi:MAG: prepilin peptidase [Patescibacteria group bacterium]